MAIFHGQRPWLYPMKVKGRFSTLHRYTSALLFFVLYAGPWLRWRGQPLFLADLPARRLYAFGQIFTPADGVLMMLLALTAAFGLFFFTTVFGRLWCGWICPQSVFWLNVVLPVEAWLEGDHQTRRRRDAGPWTFDRVWRKAAKWTFFAVFAVVTSMSFMSFFVRSEVLWTLQAGSVSYGVVAFFAGLWFFDFAWYREQTCNYVCPYARFQSALTDAQSVIISYDAERGEPRGKGGSGSCVDCRRCVNVCPQGIDIRDGFQLECIACGLCIDACATVAKKRGFENLIRYSSLAHDRHETELSFFRGRTVVYGGILVALLGAIGLTLLAHDPLELQVDRAPGSLWVEDADGFVRNTYLVHLTDRSAQDGTRTYAVEVDGLPPGADVKSTPLALASAQRSSVPLIVRVPRDAAERTLPFTVRVRGEDAEIAQATTFKGPGETDEHEHDEHDDDEHGRRGRPGED